ncbi:GntR family transcriptional regulator [Listeria booriae]|uniref:GntR family transcriptional regulator n=1 Tax=Listeria booriae TaxID=1552123 RepID=A0A7X0YTH3_9LIST|nr:GntR family transcriptional regulator [Listeria booriae]MBC1559125.1 GntR family transcriptional regulator [Listeria booriae]MBC1574450.1 GntR family transcriptional regulator [Listeria booriae]MBC1793427.1 GntR family transcriptional regulator [Listeria booriae]MBC1797302.1 GntR family transcriptional regulator [Listeria booriae]MBC1800924.1 GntR family transcriptional regulator [Listeria booriae]
MAKQNLEQQAYEHILHLITTKTLHDGDFINQSYIATELNMSRTPIRNAIARLAGEGKIRSLPRHGAFVRQH